MPFQPNFGGPRARGRYDDSSNPNSEQFRKLFIGGLSYETDENSLKSHFGQWGDLVDCIVMRDPATKRSRGFGFITYKEASQLDEAQSNRPHKIDGREVETKRAMPRDDPSNQQSVTKMFVGGLKDDTTEEMLRDCFSGRIENIEMIKDKATGKSRGFCFITFDDCDTVDKHVLKKFFDLNGRRVEVKKAVSKAEIGFGNAGRGGYGRGEFCGGNYGGYGPSGNYGPGGGSGYGPNRGGGGYGSPSWNQGGGGYGNQGWNQSGDYYGGGYGSQGGGWGGQNYNSYSGSYTGGPMKGAGGYGNNFGGGSNYSRR